MQWSKKGSGVAPITHSASNQRCVSGVPVHSLHGPSGLPYLGAPNLSDGKCPVNLRAVPKQPKIARSVGIIESMVRQVGAPPDIPPDRLKLLEG
eukprot:14548559-Alexandrium_andersonii.AAC.1